MADEFEVPPQMPVLVIRGAECGHCGEAVDMEAEVAWCTNCRVQWDRVEDGEVSYPDPDQEGSDIACKIVPRDRFGIRRYGECILPSGHEGEHEAGYSLVPVRQDGEDEEAEDEAYVSLDDCAACDAPLSSCSRRAACCGDCTHTSNWAPEKNGGQGDG